MYPSIRPAKIDDSAAISTIQKVCWCAFYTRPEQGLHEKDILNIGGFATEDAENRIALSISPQTPHHHHYVLTFSKGGIIGWATCDTKTRFLIALYVSPEQQGKGLGSYFLRWLEKNIFLHNYPLYTYTVAFNLPALAFYKRHGFVTTKHAQKGWENDMPLKKLPLMELTKNTLLTSDLQKP